MTRHTSWNGAATHPVWSPGACWGRLSPDQRAQQFTAVAEYARRESSPRVSIRWKPLMFWEYAYGAADEHLGVFMAAAAV
ncbi:MULTISPECIES: hypothetical protein [unclassified Streptomyces]|uniref:hypothetical protein n=1 Tax=unclassified Streptomyces TaxID=2593676 RepID=UPI002030B23E|nr:MULTISPECIES: hypothetical protein [unclassified Streptomyces]MCM1976036.1 hypothetical protein [Streptomyces sp. G1]MCX5129308.1 hypothetical protein [Streptomyces sp. NBC_00347]